jgi:hypothetical protein
MRRYDVHRMLQWIDVRQRGFAERVWYRRADVRGLPDREPMCEPLLFRTRGALIGDDFAALPITGWRRPTSGC